MTVDHASGAYSSPYGLHQREASQVEEDSGWVGTEKCIAIKNVLPLQRIGIFSSYIRKIKFVI